MLLSMCVSSNAAHVLTELWYDCCIGLGRSADVYPAYKLRRGQWVPVQLRLSAYAVDRLDPAGEL